MKIVLTARQTAGVVALLSLVDRHHVTAVVTDDPSVSVLARACEIRTLWSLYDADVSGLLSQADVLVSVHSRTIVPDALLALPKHGGINAHPCLSKYPGLDPVGRLLEARGTIASVGVHRMTAVIDGGPILSELFVDVQNCTTRAEVYARLYPYYAVALRNALWRLEQSELDATTRGEDARGFPVGVVRDHRCVRCGADYTVPVAVSVGAPID